MNVIDRDGDQATVSIANGGSIDGIRPIEQARFLNPQFWILDAIPLTSVLSGSVRRGTRGNGILVISEIIGLDKKDISPLFSSPSFQVNRLTFSSNATGIG